MSLQVEINFADGTRQVRTFTQERVVVGRGETADFDLQLAPEIAQEHLLLIPRRNGCWVSAASDARVKAMFEGRPFEHGLLPWGAELDVGSVSMVVKPGAKNQRGFSMWYVAALVPLAVAVFLLWPQNIPLLATPVSPPELVAPVAAGECPDGDLAASQARQGIRAAASLEARYPYDPQEGLQAVAAWLQAATCFDRAEQLSSAESARMRAKAMMDRVVEDFKAQRLVVEQARRRADNQQVLGSVRVLKRFVANSPGSYLDYLGRLERQVIVNLEKQNKHIRYAP